MRRSGPQFFRQRCSWTLSGGLGVGVGGLPCLVELWEGQQRSRSLIPEKVCSLLNEVSARRLSPISVLGQEVFWRVIAFGLNSRVREFSLWWRHTSGTYFGTCCFRQFSFLGNLAWTIALGGVVLWSHGQYCHYFKPIQPVVRGVCCCCHQEHDRHFED